MVDPSMSPERNGTVSQLLRYAVVGLASNAAGYLVYLLLTYLGMSPKLAMTLLYGVGATVSFLGNRRYTFRQQGALFGVGGRYVIAHGLGYVINLLIQVTMVDVLGYPHQLTQAFGICVVAVFLFLVFKYFVFANTDQNKTGNS
jgi:putative flippase GtrA